ncbi:unnamed protein product [Cunninghamella blakesleeana]
MTKIWKALDYSKDAISKTINKDPDLPIKKLRGGCLEIQGTWVPYAIAKSMCIKIAGKISHQLIPIFGNEIVDKSTKINYSQNKQTESDGTTGLSNRNMNIQLNESNNRYHMNLRKRKNVHSIEMPSSFTTKKKSLNISSKSLFSELSLPLSSLSSCSLLSETGALITSSNMHDYSNNNYDEFNDYIIYNDNYIDNSNDNNDVAVVPNYVYQNNDSNKSNIKRSSPIIPNFRIVPANLQQDTDATVPSYADDVNNTLHHCMLENNDIQLNMNEKEYKTICKENVSLIEASIILYALANNSRYLQQTVPKTLVINDMELRILWD